MMLMIMMIVCCVIDTQFSKALLDAHGKIINHFGNEDENVLWLLDSDDLEQVADDGAAREMVLREPKQLVSELEVRLLVEGPSVHRRRHLLGVDPDSAPSEVFVVEAISRPMGNSERIVFGYREGGIHWNRRSVGLVSDIVEGVIIIINGCGTNITRWCD